MWAKELKIKRTFAGRGKFGNDFLDELNGFITSNDIRLGQISAIGAVKTARIGFYDQELREYKELDIRGGPFEILFAAGNISLRDGRPFPHVHMAVADQNGNAFGGHLVRGTKIFALEFFITEFEGGELARETEPETGLALWKE